jgi:hypothetical protein
MKSAKRSDAGRIAALVGDDETDAYLAIHRATAALVARTGDRFFGGGGIELLDPRAVVELGAGFRPGLVAFAHELAGDWVCWDLRKGRPAAGTSPPVVYVDHELGLAEPFARDVRGALVHVIGQALVGTPGRDAASAAVSWLDEFGPVVGPKERAALARLSDRVARAGKRPVFAKTEEVAGALGGLVPKGKVTWSSLPPTDVPLLLPDDAKCLDEAVERYEESAVVYREMVHDEGRAAYAGHLAATLRGLSDVLMRRGKPARAAAAAREAIAHYEPILASGDTRIATQLAFAHHVVSAVEARAKRWATAYEHADRALTLSESVLVDYARGLRAVGPLTEAFERERAGDDPHEVQIRLDVAARETAAFVGRVPPHTLGAIAERIAGLGASRKKKRSRRR